MKDNFNVYDWKFKSKESLDSNEFNLYEWNKKRYLNELEIDQEDDNVNQQDIGGSLNITHGGDDPKIGSEEESDENVVGEGVNDREIEGKLSDLTYDFYLIILKQKDLMHLIQMIVLELFIAQVNGKIGKKEL